MPSRPGWRPANDIGRFGSIGVCAAPERVADGQTVRQDCEMSEHGGRPGLEGERLPAGPRSVVAVMPDLGSARLLMEKLEQHGVPPGSIGMEGAVPADEDEAQGEMPESSAISDVSRSTVGGFAAGAVVGGLLGALLTIPFPGLGLFWAVVLGVIFGGGIGLAAGGMAVAKFSSPAWRETYETARRDEHISVGVRHDDPEVVASAEELMRRDALEVRRLDDEER